MDSEEQVAVSPLSPPLRSCAATSSRLRFEWKHSLFHLKEPNGNEIDIQKSFATRPLQKCLIFTWTLSTIIMDYLTFHGENPFFSLAKLTYWTLIVSLLYEALSLTMTFFHDSQQKQSKGNHVHFLVLLTWSTFSIASTAGVVTTFLFWYTFLFGFTSTNVTYGMVMTHGGVALLVIIDGLVINSIPLRVKQVIFPMTFGVLYVIWTVIHAQTGIGNPREDDDGIYPVFSWNHRPAFTFTAICSVLYVLVVNPFFFFLVRSLSSLSGGRFRRVVNGADEGREGEEEEDTKHTSIESGCEVGSTGSNETR